MSPQQLGLAYATSTTFSTVMSSLRGSTSPRVTRITARASPYHSSVTLFEAKPDDGDAKELVQRSRCVNVAKTSPDIEDAVIGGTSTLGRTPSPSPGKKKGKVSSPRKIQKSLKEPHPCPPQWRETYDIIKEMRSRTVAPVDTMGCDQAHLKEEDPKVLDKFAVSCWHAYFVIEQAICNACLAHAVITDER